MDSTFHTTVLGRTELSPETYELRIARPAGFLFKAGQHIRVHQAGVERDFSLVSGPDDAVLALCIQRIAAGRLSVWLGSAPAGTGVDFTGPHGYFTFHPSDLRAVFVATGTGVAPFVSMVRAGVREFALFHGARSMEGLYYRELFEGCARPFVPCLSGVPPAALPETGVCSGRVTSFVRRHLPAGAYDFYLCGGRRMIIAVTAIVDSHFPESRVFSEVFY